MPVVYIKYTYIAMVSSMRNFENKEKKKMTRKTTKRAMLFSVLALVLCMSMFVGTTYAWFTDSVTSANNVIHSGNLDIDVQYTLDGENWADLANAEDLFQKGLWEPGHTEVVALKITNKGSLALKYAAFINVIDEVVGKTKDGKDIVLSDILTVSTLSFEDAGIDPVFNINIAERSIEEAFKNENGIAYGDAVSFKNGNILEDEKHLEPGVSQYVVIKVDMAETVGNEANHDGVNVPAITFGVNVVATQYTSESDSFGKDYDAEAYLISSSEDLKDALTKDEEHIMIELAGNVTWDTAAWSSNPMGGASTKTITINGNGNTITFNSTNSDWTNVVTGDAVLTIKNATVTNSGYDATSGTWNGHDITFKDAVVLENVTLLNAIALMDDATLTNVTLTDDSTSDAYGIWIRPNGQTVNIDGLNMDMTTSAGNDRGIKIDNEYAVANDNGVTLNVKNATFKTEKKAAILVKSTGNVNITLENIDISGVAADPFNEVWVDDAAAANADKVTVTGGKVIVEGGAGTPNTNSVAAGTTVPMGTVIKSGAQTVINNEGTIDLSGKPNLGGGDVVINGGTVSTTSVNYTGLQHAGEVTYNGVTFNGGTFLYGDKVVFNDCTFNLTTNYLWTYGAEEVEFNNCTFNTNGKAVLIYKEQSTFSSVITIDSCTFNATASGYAGAVPNQACAAVEIDSSLIYGTYTVNFVGNNVVDKDFSGLVRIKSGADKNNVTINGATPVELP